MRFEKYLKIVLVIFFFFHKNRGTLKLFVPKCVVIFSHTDRTALCPPRHRGERFAPSSRKTHAIRNILLFIITIYRASPMRNSSVPCRKKKSTIGQCRRRRRFFIVCLLVLSGRQRDRGQRRARVWGAPPGTVVK